MYIACNMPGIRSSRFLTFGALVIVFCAVAGGFWGRSALVAQDQIPDQYKVFTAALGAIEENYVGEVRIGPAGLQRHHRPAADARSAFELHGSAQLRADARAAGGPLLRARHHDQRRRRRRHHLQRVRRVPRASEGAAPRRRDREDRGRGRQRAGRANRPSVACADRSSPPSTFPSAASDTTGSSISP